MANRADRVAEEIAAQLKEQGFKKRRRTWTRSFADLLQVFNVQASDWSQDDFYINLGIYIKDLGDLERPPEYKCHIRRRVPEADVPAMLDYGLGWLDKRTTIAELRDQTIGGDPREAVMIIAREYLLEIANGR